MSLNKHECQEHTHEVFNDRIILVSNYASPFVIVPGGETNKTQRIVLSGDNDFTIERDDAGNVIKNNLHNGNKGGIALLGHDTVGYSVVFKMYGDDNAQIRSYPDGIILHNLNDVNTERVIYKLDLIKWIRAVNKAVFGSDDLTKNTHDYVYKETVVQ